MGPQNPQRLADQTADRLLHMIGNDPAYGPGARLPNEPRLCTLFGVSRTTLREAIRSLAAQGYVEVRRGSGTFVLDRTMVPDIGLQRLESLRTRLRDLFEIRMMIEPQAARPVSYTHLRACGKLPSGPRTWHGQSDREKTFPSRKRRFTTPS